MSAPTYRDLRNMGAEHLIEIHDQIAETTGVNVNYCLNELHRREQDELSRSVEKYTARVWWATAVILVATLANVGLEIHRYTASDVTNDRDAAHSLPTEHAQQSLDMDREPGVDAASEP